MTNTPKLTDAVEGGCHHSIVVPLYPTGEQVRAGDRVRIGKADCTVVRFIPSMVVVSIDGIPNHQHGIPNEIFAKTPRPPQWREMNEDSLSSMSGECDRCGSDKSRVLTVSIDGRLYDGDLIECIDCKHNGTISVVDGDAFCEWDELPTEWPCQQFHGGRDSGVMEDSGRCRHAECNPRHNANVDLPDTAAQDSASKSNNPAVSG